MALKYNLVCQKIFQNFGTNLVKKFEGVIINSFITEKLLPNFEIIIQNTALGCGKVEGA